MLVSVVLPIYNVKEYLEECVDSLIGQTYKNIEILLVDDGSNDGTELLCDKLSEKDGRIKVFHKENGGTHTARNLGIEKSIGEYIIFIDPDDWLETDAIEKLVNLAEESTLDVVRFNYVREFGEYSAKKENTLLSEEICEGEECKKVCRQTLGLINEELSNPESLNFLASACFALYRKSIITENSLKFSNIREIATFSDGLFNFTFLLHSSRFKFIDECFYHYRKFNSGAATSKYREDFLKRQNILFDKLYKLVEEIDEKEFYEAYNARISMSTMELCLNALKSNKSCFKKYKEMKAVLNNDRHRSACRTLTLKDFPLKWKLYYMFVKYKITPFVYFMTCAIRFIQRRG